MFRILTRHLELSAFLVTSFYVYGKRITVFENGMGDIYAVQQDTQSVLMSEFIQLLRSLDMFRTSSVHHQERFLQAVFADFGMW